MAEASDFGFTLKRVGAAWAMRSAKLRRIAPLLVLMVMAVILSVTTDNFFSIGNMSRLATAAAIPAVLSLGATFVILLGGIDLSLEGVMAVSGTTMAMIIAANPTVTMTVLGCVAAIAVGAALGGVSGALHVTLRVPSFMVTLGVWLIGTGVSSVMLGGATVVVRDSPVRVIAVTRFAGLSLGVWVAFAAVLAAWIIQNYTRLGRRAYALGGGEDIAKLSGLSIRSNKIAIFSLAGAFSGLASVLAVGQIGQSNALIGDGRLFMTITAVVVGGTALTGGYGGVINSMLGVLIVTVIANGMILLGISPLLQQAVQGLLIIVAVASSLDRKLLQIVK